MLNISFGQKHFHGYNKKGDTFLNTSLMVEPYCRWKVGKVLCRVIQFLFESNGKLLQTKNDCDQCLFKNILIYVNRKL